MAEHEERMRRAAEQEQRALQALESILSGRGSLGEETLTLSNEFTDRHTARFGAWLRRVARRPDRPDRRPDRPDSRA